MDAPRTHDGTDEAGPDGHEEVLGGGSMTAVVRRGGAVHRTAGPWTPTVHRLLEHLRERGVTWLPGPLGIDERGREVLTHLPGTVPTYPMPAFVWTRGVLVTSARWLALVHQASVGFDAAGALWQLPAHEPAEVVCLNDVAPHNMVFDADGSLTGWIDVDVASPGPRAWDLAHLAHRLVPLSPADDTGAGPVDLDRARERLALLCTAYAGSGGRTGPDPAEVLDVVVARLEDLAVLTEARARAGNGQVAGHADLYRSDAAWVERFAAALGAGAQRRGSR